MEMSLITHLCFIDYDVSVLHWHMFNNTAEAIIIRVRYYHGNEKPVALAPIEIMFVTFPSHRQLQIF